MNKIARDIIILHKCTKNHNHMLYGSWGKQWDTEFLFIVGHFLPFYSPNDPKNQNCEKMKKILGRYHPFTHGHHKWRSYDMVPEI